MKKKLILIVLIVFIIIMLPRLSKAIAEDNVMDTFIQEQLNNLNIQELELVLEDIFRGNEIDYPKISIKNAISSILKGEQVVNTNEIMSQVYSFFLLEIRENLILIAQILAITIACSILTNLRTSFEGDNIAELAHYICYILLAMLTVNSFVIALELGKKTVVQMVDFMQVILPILLTLMTVVSGPNTKLLFHPVVLGTVSIIGFIIKNLVFPLILFSFIIGIISNISEKIQFSQLSKLIRQIIIGIVTSSLTIFIGIITIFGIGTKVDGMTIRTAKFAVDNLVPIVGKFLSDAVETVVSCSAIVKNGIGLIGLLTIFLICIIPIIKIIVLMLAYKILGAIVQPIASENIVNFFDEVGKALLLVMIGMISVATMFFMTITIIVEMGNATIMLR